MKRATVLSLSLFVALLAPAIAAADAKLEAVREKVTAMFDIIEPEDINGSPVDGWYTIQKGSVVAYISDDGRYMMQGDLIDLDQNVNLSEEARTDARRDLISSVDEAQFITFSPEEPKYSVAIFTDVDCTYCRRLHQQIDDYLEQGIEVRYLLYPRNGPASRAWSTSEAVWCSTDRQAALTNAKLGQTVEATKCDASTVQTHYALGQEVGLSGTPAIVLEDGELIGGYLPPQALRGRLDQKTTRAN